MDTRLNISIIVAVAENGVIGQNGKIPWSLPSDLLYFAKLTKGHTVIVGRKTYESIIKRLGHSLSDRQTIVITRQQNFPVPNNCEISASWEETLKKVRREEEVFVIGGAEIYCLALPYAKRIYLTKVHTQCDGDTFSPVYDIAEWQEIFSEPHGRDEKNEHDYTFTILEKKKSTARAKEKPESFVNLENARVEEQREVMKMIQEQGFCPFCPENISKSQLEPVIKQGQYWHIRENHWPYKNTRVHLIVIHNTHIEKLSEISPEAAKELFELAKWTEDKYQISGGGIGLRFGDFRLNGGTVLHLHVHIVTADITNRDDLEYQPVHFRVG
ncbi:MAG: HIT domain-containing protein [Dehalococcoidia bacterium]|nr:MAG: HIT domain-containing protein [Dehalococcoidia bacterium]